MGDRIWLSPYTTDDLNGGIESLSKKYCDILNLKQLSARRLGVNIKQNIWDVTLDMDRALDDWSFDLVIYDSICCWSKKPNAKQSVCICHDNFKREMRYINKPTFSQMKKIQWELQKKSISNADKVVTISKWEHDNLVEDLGVDSYILESSVDLNGFTILDKTESKRRLGLSEDRKTFLFVGRNHIRKGYDIIEDMIKRFPEHDFVNIIDRRGNLENKYKNVVELEKVPNDKLNMYYNASDYLILPSRYESFGLVLIEAMAVNLPVIATKVGIAFDIPKDFIQLSEEPNSDDFENAIKIATGRKFGNGRELIADRFSYDTMSKKLKEIVGE